MANPYFRPNERVARIVISGIHNVGDFKEVDESKQTLLVDISPAKKRRVHFAKEKQLNTEAKKRWIFLGVLWAMLLFCLPSYYLQVFSPNDGARGPSPPPVEIMKWESVSQSTPVSRLSNSIENGVKRAQRVVSEKVAYTIRPVIEGELDIPKSAREMYGALSSSLSGIRASLVNGRRNALMLLSEMDDILATIRQSECNRAWHNILQRDCRKLQKREKSCLSISVSRKQLLESIWTRQGRGQLRASVDQPSTMNATVSMAELHSSTSPPQQTKERRKVKTFRDNVKLGFQAHTANYQRTQQRVAERHEANYIMRS